MNSPHKARKTVKQKSAYHESFQEVKRAAKEDQITSKMSTHLRSFQGRLVSATGVGFVLIKAFLDFLGKIRLNKNSVALSVSVGDGVWDYLAFKTKNDIKKIIATDIVDCAVKGEDISILRSLGEWNFVKVEPEKEFPFSDNMFDLIFHQDTIEHVYKPYLFLKEQYRVLKNGGYIIFGTPNLLRPVNIAKIFLGKIYFPVKIGFAQDIGNYVHIQEFTEWQLVNMVKEVGFKNISIANCFWGLHFLNLQFRDFPKSQLGKTMCHYIMICAEKDIEPEPRSSISLAPKVYLLYFIIFLFTLLQPDVNLAGLRAI